MIFQLSDVEFEFKMKGIVYCVGTGLMNSLTFNHTGVVFSCLQLKNLRLNVKLTFLMASAHQVLQGIPRLTYRFNNGSKVTM